LTHAALPNPPTSVIVTDVSAHSISVSWNSGNVEPISSYVVQFRAKYPTTSVGGGTEGEEAEWRETVDVLRTEFTVRGLLAFTVYELRVLTVTSIGRSPPSTSVDVTTAELGQSRAVYTSASGLQPLLRIRILLLLLINHADSVGRRGYDVRVRLFVCFCLILKTKKVKVVDLYSASS